LSATVPLELLSTVILAKDTTSPVWDLIVPFTFWPKLIVAQKHRNIMMMFLKLISLNLIVYEILDVW
jgi:hypothetical protein